MKSALIAAAGAAVLIMVLVLVVMQGMHSSHESIPAAEEELTQRELERLDAQVSGLADRQASLAAEVEALAARLEKVEASPRAEIVAASLDTTAADSEAGEGNDETPDDETASVVAAIDRPEFQEALDVLLDPQSEWDAKYATWQGLARDGLIDDAVAYFQERAAANPHDPDAQADLGDACIQKIFTVPDPEKATWSMKADAAYDKALAIDPQHWNARFSKAINYSFAPPAFGLQSKAIEHFEVLRQQQEARPPEDRFAQTYLFLGNLHDSRGDREKAREVWSRGLTFFPDDDDLNTRLAGDTPGDTAAR